MGIGVLLIVSGFKIRTKLDGVNLLFEKDKKTADAMMEEIKIWIKNSDREISPVIITPFNEIYEIAVRKHIKAVKNDFAMASEGNMIKFGINNFPGFSTYMILSSADIKIFKAEIFESICMHYDKTPKKIVFSKYQNKLRLPVIFSSENLKLVNSVISREKGRFVFRSNAKNSTYIEVTDDMIETVVYERKDAKKSSEKEITIHDVYSGALKSGITGFEDYRKFNSRKVIIVRGGGRLGSAVAVILNRFGFSVLITEKDVPDTLFRENSFSKAVYATKKKIGQGQAYLVSPARDNLSEAWSEGIIPVVIDPGLEILDLFKNDNNIFPSETEIVDPLDKFRNENSSSQSEIAGDKDRFKRYRLFAVCDFTSDNEKNKTMASFAPVTIGTDENGKYPGGPGFLVSTSHDFEFSAIVPNFPFDVSRIPAEGKEILNNENDVEKEAYENKAPDKVPERESCFFTGVKMPAYGKFKEIRKIGEYVNKGDIIAQAEEDNQKKHDIISPCTGVITGAGLPGRSYNIGEYCAAISESKPGVNIAGDIFPCDSAVAFSVLSKLIESEFE